MPRKEKKPLWADRAGSCLNSIYIIEILRERNRLNEQVYNSLSVIFGERLSSLLEEAKDRPIGELFEE